MRYLSVIKRETDQNAMVLSGLMIDGEVIVCDKKKKKTKKKKIGLKTLFSWFNFLYTFFNIQKN